MKCTPFSVKVAICWMFAFAFVFSCNLKQVQAWYISEPSGAIDLDQDKGVRQKIAFINFHSDRRSDEERQGWLLLIQNELNHRNGLEGHFEVVSRDEWRGQMQKSLGTPEPNTIWIPRIKNIISTDYLLSIDERWHYDGWVWLLRVYNGKSGAFLSEYKIEVVEDHAQWVLERVLYCIEGLAHKELTRNPQNVVLPECHLPLELLEQLHTLWVDCSSGKCIKWLSRLEDWMTRYPEFVESLLSNSMFTTKLMKDADNPYDRARVNRLAGELMDAKKGLERALPDLKDKKERQKYLLLLAQVVLETGRIDEADELFSKTLEISSKNKAANFGKAEILRLRGDCEKALPLYGKFSRDWDFKERLMSARVACFNQAGRIQEAIREKEKLANCLDEKGRHKEASVIWTELLEVDFRFDWLAKMRFHLLRSERRNNFENVMSRFSIREDRDAINLLKQLARLVELSGKFEEADRIRRSALQTAKDDAELINDIAWTALKIKNEPVESRRLLDKLPSSKRDKFLELLTEESLGAWDKAIKIINSTGWKKGQDIESAIVGLRLLEHMGEALRIVRQADKWIKKYPDREELYLAKAAIEKASVNGDKKLSSRLMALQIAGQEVAKEDLGNYFNKEIYRQLISPHPMVSFQNGSGLELKYPGKVLLVQGRMRTGEENWFERLGVYIERQPNVLQSELSGILEKRYDLNNDEIIRVEMEKKFFNLVHIGKSNLADMALAAGVDSIFILIYDAESSHRLTKLSIPMKLYYYDGVSGFIYRSQAQIAVPFFQYFKFNKIWLAMPVGIIIFLSLMLWWFSRATLHWSSPLEYARYLIGQRNYHKAVEVLDRFGYLDDKLWVSALAFTKEGNYIKAMENFLRAKDLDNAYYIMQYCTSGTEADNLKGELFTRLGEYNRALASYHSSRNLIGISKVLAASGDDTRAVRVMAQYYLETKNPMAAIEQYKKILDYDRAALVFYHYQRYEEAAELFEKSNNYEMMDKCRKRMGRRRNTPRKLKQI